MIFTGPPRFPGEERRVAGDHVRVFLLAAETAARRGLDDPDLVGWQREEGPEGRLDVVRALEGARDDERAVVLEPGRHPVVLDVGLLLMRDEVLALDDCIGRLQRPLHVAPFDRDAFLDVVFPVDDYRCLQGFLHREHRWRLAIGDSHVSQCRVGRSRGPRGRSVGWARGRDGLPRRRAEAGPARSGSRRSCRAGRRPSRSRTRPRERSGRM